ncbi:MAG: hypothetical protein IKO00_10945 [Oscillospiraceae bacterium]|nr:hypothetical protein [Oscillospiraceae bacterium]
MVQIQMAPRLILIMDDDAYLILYNAVFSYSRKNGNYGRIDRVWILQIIRVIGTGFSDDFRSHKKRVFDPVPSSIDFRIVILPGDGIYPQTLVPKKHGTLEHLVCCIQQSLERLGLEHGIPQVRIKLGIFVKDRNDPIDDIEEVIILDNNDIILINKKYIFLEYSEIFRKETDIYYI